jgi:hypothetical protein
MRRNPHMSYAIRSLVLLQTIAVLFGGCMYSSEVRSPSAVSARSGRSVAYPDGRYELYGAGTTTSPYYWVWIPNDTTPPAPPVTVARTEKTLMYPEGRYELYGAGTTSSPYYWVWIPSGTTPPPPPPPPSPSTLTGERP